MLLLPVLRKFQDITQIRQREDLTISDARTSFNESIKEFSLLQPYIGLDARIVRDPDFEFGVTKVLSQEKLFLHRLNREHSSISRRILRYLKLLKKVQTARLSLKEQVEARTRKTQICDEGSSHIDPTFVIPTSHICKRVFCAAGRAYSESRRILGIIWDLRILADSISKADENKSRNEVNGASMRHFILLYSSTSLCLGLLSIFNCSIATRFSASNHPLVN
jgi:hypothetical protein